MTRSSELRLAVALSVLLAGAALFGLMKDKAEGQAVTTVQLPAATVTSVTSGAAVTIAPTNPGRRTFSICNGTAGSVISVLPGTATTVTATTGIQIASATCLSPPPNLLQSGTMGGGGNSWQAIAAGTTAVVSFIEW